MSRPLYYFGHRLNHSPSMQATLLQRPDYHARCRCCYQERGDVTLYRLHWRLVPELLCAACYHGKRLLLHDFRAGCECAECQYDRRQLARYDA